MHLLTWNVGHQTRRRPLPREFADALGDMKPDVLVLTEYVADDSHADFHNALRQHGLAYHLVTDSVKGQNQVLVASCRPLGKGPLACTNISAATVPNWLHVQSSDVNLVGFRVPMFGTGSQGRARYWQWLADSLPTLVDCPTILLGDFNAAPTYRPLRALVAAGWQLVTPSVGWSFRGKTGHASSIDHGLVTRHFRPTDVEYVVNRGKAVFAGSATAYSDHAVLSFRVHRVA